MIELSDYIESCPYSYRIQSRVSMSSLVVDSSLMLPPLRDNLLAKQRTMDLAGPPAEPLTSHGTSIHHHALKDCTVPDTWLQHAVGNAE